MKTNFFEQIAGLAFNGTLQINIQTNDIGTLAVTLLLANPNPKITQGNNIPPMLLKATPQELDEAFFEQITEPVKQTVKLFTNLDSYQAEIEKANKKPEKANVKNTTTTKKAADSGLFNQPSDEEPDDDEADEVNDAEAIAEKQRLYEEAMDRVKNLNSQMKYAEAIAQLPDKADYPDKIVELTKTLTQLQGRQKTYEDLQKAL